VPLGRSTLHWPDGATVDQIVKRFEWQQHTARGAIAGALKKKLGSVGANRVRPPIRIDRSTRCDRNDRSRQCVIENRRGKDRGQCFT
jgi:hypothetical protein